MEVIRGFAEARNRLARKVELDFGVSERDRQRLKKIFGRDISPEEAVQQILRDVREKGDAAVTDYTARIDGFNIPSLEVKPEQIREAYRQVDKELVEALKLAAERIDRFHREQKEAVWKGIEGEEYGQIVLPLARVGLYAPGGMAAYPSSLLMIAIPPRVAGVKEIILTTPPRDNGSIPAATLVASDIAGIDRIYAIGGAQAIAAMAYGTDTVPGVDKICGPGNLFVMLAKKQVFGTVDIDALQGPSEVFIIASDSANAEYCAADLLAQAEHGQLPQVILATTSPALAEDVQVELQKQLALLPRREIAGESLEKRGMIVVVDSLDEALELANLYAPEHLELAFDEAESYLGKVLNAGCVFVGEFSTEPIGDYVAGPNHSLPTGGTARFSSPLNILDFMKIIDVVRINREALKKLGPAAMIIARAEGLEAHAKAIEKRIRSIHQSP
ncbi:MAG: histidinol dehydrogenase [Dehalococcoidales bacterium]|nr:histidinol dehydrogenase [Dehalococcoidales bacterium]